MTHEGYKKAAEFWMEKDKAGNAMPQEELEKAVEDFLTEHNTCALATANGDFVRCTPIEYTYCDKALWIFSEGGEKFKALEYNDNVCAAIFESFSTPTALKGMQVTGKAVIVEPFSDEYNAAAERRHIPIEALKKLKLTMNLICVKIDKVEYTNSEFKNDGYYIRQKLNLI